VIWLTITDPHRQINAREKDMCDLGKLLLHAVVIGPLLNRDINMSRDDEMQCSLVRSVSTRKGKYKIESTDPRVSGAAGGDSRR
jgi:hypothetical protein